MCNMAGRETTLHMEYLPPIPLSKKYEFPFKKDSLALFSLAVITKKLFLESLGVRVQLIFIYEQVKLYLNYLTFKFVML